MSARAQAGVPAQLVIVQEPGTTTAGAVITPHLEVQVRDALGSDVAAPGIPIVVTLTAGSGTLLGTTTRDTDVNGLAEFDDLSIQTAGAGDQLTASSGSLTAAVSTGFDITAAAPAALAFNVQPSNAVAGVAFSPAVQVKVTDSFGNPVASQSVTLALVGTGTLSGYAPTNTDASGVATFPTLSVDLAGTKHLDASAGSVGPVSSASFDITAAAPATLAFNVQPSNAVAGVAFSPAVQVKVTDGLGNAVAGQSVTLALVGTGTLSGYAPTVTDPSGVATFATLSVDLAGTKHLDASAGGAGPVSSANFDITAAAPATLAFTVQPSNAVAGVAFSPPVRVKVTDGFGNPVATELVSLSLVGSGSLTGYAPTATDASGVATFATLAIDHSGTGKQLVATTSSLGPVSSAAFDITCPTLTMSPPTLPQGTQGTAYSQFCAAGGGAPPYAYTISAGALPGGLALNASTGEIAGTPGASGTFGFTVTATDAAGCAVSQPYSLVIVFPCPPIAVQPPTLPTGSLTVAYSQACTPSAGTAPFTFALTAGALPAGLSLSPTGVIAGTPVASGSFGFTVGVTDANGCTGSQAYTLQILAIPAAIADLTAPQVLSGNDADGTTKIQILFSTPSGAASVEVYRAGFSHYPEYDDDGGAVPATPSYPPGAPWVLTGVTAGGQTDEPATRDFYYYVAFSKNAAGGVSAVSNKTAGSLNYFLGDVSNGFVAGQGNNAVGDEDISLLGANYGIGESEITQRHVEYLDVGPTTDLLVTSRPFTDDRIDFEDFIVFATNYHEVSGPARATRAAQAAAAAAAGPEEFRVVAPSMVEPGHETAAELWLHGAGRLQGFAAQLSWDPTVVEPIAMTSTSFLEAQKGLVLSPKPGGIDAALLGMREKGMSGEGTVARVSFRVLRAGDARIRLATLEVRDAANRPLPAGMIEQSTLASPPGETTLLAPTPNPFQERSELVFSLARAGEVELAIYSVDGRRVRTLASGARAPGVYHLTWDGRDEARNPVAPGVFYARLAAAGRQFTKTVVRLR
jgi:hypothetical protein